MSEFDPLDELTPDDFQDRIPQPLKRRLLVDTSRLLRRRTRVRRLAWIIPFAACFLIAAWWTSRHEPPVRSTSPLRQLAVGKVAFEPPFDSPVPEPELMSPIQSTQPVFALDMEWQAFDSKENRAELYLQAGDKYWNERDYASALRCYRIGLDVGADLTFSMTDNSLVMALKMDRRKDVEDEDKN